MRNRFKEEKKKMENDFNEIKHAINILEDNFFVGDGVVISILEKHLKIIQGKYIMKYGEVTNEK